MIDPKYADVVEALYAYVRNEFNCDEKITDLSKPIGLAYTEIYDDDDTIFCDMQVSVHIPSRTIIYTNDWTGEVYGREQYDDLDDLLDCLNTITFDDCYSDWLGFAHSYTGRDLH